MTAGDPLRYHAGWPPRDRTPLLERIARGLPVYFPADPKPIDQRIYLEFARTRGPNSE